MNNPTQTHDPDRIEFIDGIYHVKCVERFKAKVTDPNGREWIWHSNVTGPSAFTAIQPAPSVSEEAVTNAGDVPFHAKTKERSDKVMLAKTMHSEGYSYRQIAKACGWSSPRSAVQAVNVKPATAAADSEALPTIIISGPTGCGKTVVAFAIQTMMRQRFLQDIRVEGDTSGQTKDAPQGWEIDQAQATKWRIVEALATRAQPLPAAPSEEV